MIPVSKMEGGTNIGNTGQNGHPILPTPPAAQAAGSLDPLSTAILFANTNPYIIGMFMLILNLGGRFLSLELTKKQEAVLQSQWIRPLILFTVIFIATRNLVVAFWMTIVFFFVIWVVANENSPYCMIPSWCDPTYDTQRTTYEKNIALLGGGGKQ